MSKTLSNQLTSLGVILVVSLLVWRYYRTRTFPLSERYSTFGPRFWAGPVDSCVLWPVTFITTALLSLNLPRAVAAVVVVLETVAWLLYTVFMHARYGQTIGKMVGKVRVVDFRTEAKISLLQAWLREGIPAVASFVFLVYEVIAILRGRLSPQTIASGELDVDASFWIMTTLPGLWFLAEVLTMLTNEKRRALHDFIAGTVVVRLNVQTETGGEIVAPLAGSDPSPSPET